MAEAFIYSLKKQNSHVPACDRAVFIPIYFSAWAAYVVCQQGGGKEMGLFYQYAVNLALKCPNICSTAGGKRK